MVLQKRIDYGINGYQVPRMPQGPRSARRRRLFIKKFDDNQMCAFDLLATVAGNILVEGENSLCHDKSVIQQDQCAVPKDTVETEHLVEAITPKLKLCDKGVFDNTTPTVIDTAKDACLGLESFGSKINVGPSSSIVSFPCILANEVEKKVNTCNLVHPATLDNSAKFTCKDYSPRGGYTDDLKLVSRDDDENSSWCAQSSTVNKALRPSPCIADRRIRKILASKCWKVTQKLEAKHFSNNAETKPVFSSENCYNCQRSARDYPFKKRKLYDSCSLSGSNPGDILSSLPEQDSNGDALVMEATKHEVTGTSAFALDHHESFQSTDSHVKLKIKSFRIPELFVEIPETATVGSLKRTVMDAVKAILSGGLRVGVLVQGKKIRDDNKTLVQSGISHDDKMLNTLGFTLEPSQLPNPLCAEDRSFVLPCETPKPLASYPPAPIVQRGTCDTSMNRPIKSYSNLTGTDHDTVPSLWTPPNTSGGKSLTKSKALVTVPMNVDGLAVVPVQKPKRSDVSQQRRIRRPFSVSEVEALVQAVEKLGTGRWRDVKLQAFDNAMQRTYVDLKDKWKTLVHTARISPQQRRGEPVPQELLDRVLTAHAYWSQRQPKQHHHLRH